MKIVVWVVSALVAIVFLVVGGLKLVAPAADLADATDVPVTLLRVAGVTEVLGALGLILPAATRILPILTPVAATGLALQMIGAIIASIAVGEYTAIPTAAILMLASAWIAWQRFGRHAVQPRSQVGGRVSEAT